jgi:hypothetical protein
MAAGARGEVGTEAAGGPKSGGGGEACDFLQEERDEMYWNLTLVTGEQAL